MNPIIFAGPSVYGLDLGDAGDLDLAPPARCGDVLKAVQQGRQTIGLIDGGFETGPAVWHKELMFALASGCIVVGSSSMGALRAVECSVFGMIGVGEVFDDFRTGRRTSDADVALTHGPAELGYVPLSVALVDVEDAAARMRQAGELDETQHARILHEARTTFFKERTWDHVLLSAGISRGVAEHLKLWIAGNGPGVKARDALLLFREVVRLHRRARAEAGGFLATRFFSQLLVKSDNGW